MQFIYLHENKMWSKLRKRQQILRKSQQILYGMNDTFIIILNRIQYKIYKIC